MPHKRAPRKRQTRLDFSPLPDSSPAKLAQPEAVRSRAAGVIIEGSSSPAKRQKTSHQSLPTPDASSAPAPPSTARSTRSFMHANSRLRSSPAVKSSPSQAPGLRDQLRNIFPSDSDSDEPVAPVRSSQRSTRTQVVSSDEDDLVEVNKPRLTKRPHKSLIRDDQDDEVDNLVAHSPRRARRARQKPQILESDDDEDEIHVRPAETPRRLRRLRQPSLPSDSDAENSNASSDAHSQQEQPRRSSIEEADLQEDLDFLAPSPEAEDTPRAASSKSATKSAKQKALEALKRKRQRRERNTNAAPSDEDDEQEAYVIDDAEPTAEDWEDHGEPEEDWIVDEEDEEGSAQIPIEYRLRTMKPKDLFKIAVEWYVQRKLNPAFDRDNDAYHIAFTRLSDFVNGMGGSKYQSSAWTAVFRRSLLGRPVLQETQCPGEAMLRDRCDACNRSGHPATYEVMFTGKPYDKISLEEFSDDEDNTGQETELPDASKVYYIGKFCMRNARVAHQLHHWRFHLSEWIVDYLKEQGHLTPEKILRRDGQSTSKRGRAANKVVEQMEQSGEIKNLYRDFQHEIDAAQHGEGAGSSQLAYDSD